MNKKKTDKYWIVVGEHVSRNPFRHKTYTEAFQESTRLALKYPKDIFTVFGSICLSQFIPNPEKRVTTIWSKIKKKALK